MPKERLHNIDLLKGIGAILVIFGHLDLPEAIHNAIYFFHMPLFFVLSGMFWQKKNTA